MPQRHRTYPRGRWQTQRERLHIEEEEPPAPYAECRRLGDLLPRVLKRLGIQSEPWLESLQTDWESAVGAAVARHTRPGRLERRRLTVFVDSPVWRNELERFAKTEMLDRLQQKFGKEKIESVSLQIDPEGGRPSR